MKLYDYFTDIFTDVIDLNWMCWVEASTLGRLYSGKPNCHFVVVAAPVYRVNFSVHALAILANALLIGSRVTFVTLLSKHFNCNLMND